MTPEERIIARIKDARHRAGLSQEDVAHRLGVVLRTYARWERCETSGWLPRIDEIAKAVGTTSDELIGADRMTPATVEELMEIQRLTSLKLDAVLSELRLLRQRS